MRKRFFLFTRVFLLFAFAMPFLGFSQTVGVFYDNANEQMKFAAADVKTALEAKSLTVEMLPLSSLSSTYVNNKVVIALATNTAVTTLLINQGGSIPTGLGEQSYALRTTTQSQTSFWVLGGDANGAMYGGLQMAENIQFNGFAGMYNVQESPTIKKRGIKMNLPFDVKSPTYFSNNNSTASKNAIANVWDMTFWTTWFDEMARMRYNIVSVWNNHPFTSMIKLPKYPNVILNNVTGYPNIYNDNDYTGVVLKTMTIDEKIEFWRKVMAYAKGRGFDFYLFNWNVFLSNAKGQYNMTDGSAGVTNQATIDYLRECMYTLLETYPNLDGFGVTEGEGMSTNDENNSAFLANSYGKGMVDFAKSHPDRKLNFIHRWHMADFTLIKKNFSELFTTPNITFDMSFKYSGGHMYSSANPQIFKSSDISSLKSNNIKTWFTVRNEDFFFHNWGSPEYAREYLKNIPGQGDWFKGFYIGSDGFHQTRTFFSKNSITQGQLEIQRLWYMNMIWGRLAYNPNISDDVFKNYMKLRFPGISSNDLFTAWSKASNGLPKVGEIIFGDLDLDFKWYPENCQDKDGFLTIAKFAAANPRSTSKLCGIMSSASASCSGKISTYAIADQIEADALAALTLVNPINAGSNTELGVAINNIKALSYLTIYYAYKIRGATFSKASNKAIETREALGKAYCWWMKYSNLMDANFKGMSCQRVAKFDTWHQHDASVLKEYTDAGGVGTPSCDVTCTVTAITNGCTGSTVDITGSNNCGGSVALTAKPAANCNFVNFTDGTTTWTTNPLTVNVTANKQYTANFSGALQAPVADFTSNTTSVLVGGTVNFTDSSANTPTSWSWSFPGGTPATSTAQKPSVKYDTAGAYDVTLTTTNAFGSNLKTKAKYVVVSKPATNVTSLTGWVAGTDNPKAVGSNRLLVVMVMGESTGDFAATSVTYGGQTMTKQTDRSYYVASSRSYASIFTLNEAGLNLATNGTIVANWDVTPSSGNSIYSTILSNVDQATPVSAVSNNALTGTTVTIPSGLATASGDMVVMCGATEKNNVQGFDNGFTKEFESDTTWGDGVGGYKIGNGQIETPSFTQSLSGRMVICAFVAKKLAAPLAVDDFGNASKNAIKIYPNPTSGILNINFPNSDMSREIQIINTLGQKVHSVKTHNNHITIDVKSLNLKGFIVVKVIAEDGVSNHKVLVK